MNEKAKKKLEAMQEEIQYALEDLVIGQLRSPHLPGRMKRTIQGVLARHQIRNAKILISSQGSGYIVDLTLPPQGPIVTTVRLRFG